MLPYMEEVLQQFYNHAVVFCGPFLQIVFNIFFLNFFFLIFFLISNPVVVVLSLAVVNTSTQ